MNDEVDLTQFSRISHPGKAFWRGHFTENAPSISRSTSIFLIKINVGQERITGMESILTFSKSALTRLLSVPVLGLAGVSASSVISSQSDRSWHEDYLIGKSDMDAIWYYERRRWLS